MNKVLSWSFAAALICGLNLFSSCSNDDNPVDPADNLAEKIIGKWIDAEFDGQPALTSDKSVVTFVSPTKATYSISRTDFTETQIKWSVYRECDVEISGNKVTLTGHPEGNTSITLQEEYIINSITDTEMVCIYRHTTFHDGQARGSVDEKNVRMKKIDTDYRADIIGLWECEGISGGDTYNDANARLEFFDDGTYNFYRKNDAGYWESVTTREFQDYFVDGTLLATRWKDQGEDEHRECWEIESINGDDMLWTALRQNADGSTFQQDVRWKKTDHKYQLVQRKEVIEESGVNRISRYGYDDQGRLTSFVKEGYDTELGEVPETRYTYTYGDHYIKEQQVEEGYELYTLNDDGLIVKQESIMMKDGVESVTFVISFQYENGRISTYGETDNTTKYLFQWKDGDLMSFYLDTEKDVEDITEFTLSELTVDHGYRMAPMSAMSEPLYLMGYYGKPSMHLESHKTNSIKTTAYSLFYESDYTYTIDKGHIVELVNNHKLTTDMGVYKIDEAYKTISTFSYGFLR